MRRATGPCATVVVDVDVQQRLELCVREVQVLIGVSRGLTNADIGRRLYLSDHTIKTHTGHLFRKLGASRPRAGGQPRLAAGAVLARADPPGPRLTNRAP